MVLMRLPAIRYPLPTLVTILCFSFLLLKAENWSRPLRSALVARWDRLRHGPPVPSSTKPMTSGLLQQRALLLKPEVAVFDRPNGTRFEQPVRQGIVLLYDGWSARGEAAPSEFFHIGTRQPIGWIAAEDCLPWNTRLVLMIVTSSGSPTLHPIVSWSKQTVTIVEWSPGEYWKRIARTSLISDDHIEEKQRGVLIAEAEMPQLLALALASSSAPDADRVRLQALLGELVEPTVMSENDVASSLGQLPDWAGRRPPAHEPVARLSELNASKDKDRVRIGDQWFRFVPMSALP